MEHIPPQAFRPAIAQQSADPVPQTQPEGYLRGSLRRFGRHTSSVAAGLILAALLAFGLLTPLFSAYDVSFRDGYYQKALPKWEALGIDGCARESGSQARLDYYMGIGQEYGGCAVKEILEISESGGAVQYKMDVDAYEKVGFVYLDLSQADYEALIAYQERTGHQVLYPMPRLYQTGFVAVASAANLWYELADEGIYSAGESAHHDENGMPIFVADYLLDENGKPVYAVKNQTGVRCRVRYSEYFRYRNGVLPAFLFGTNQHGQDILACLASGARLSFLLALSVSLINFAIGICYGAAEGYYGGRVDLIMERIADILAAVPFIVVATLFQLHFAQQAGPVLSLLFAFVLTGWIGIASRVRAQFYRYKNAEYVLAARTLGAGDGRLIFHHILPNAIGTIITGTVLMIPGVIFSESMLSYLGIVNLESAGFTSLGTMLSAGRGYLGSYPHILAFPAVFIALLEISFNLFGNGLRDAFHPQSQTD